MHSMEYQSNMEPEYVVQFTNGELKESSDGIDFKVYKKDGVKSTRRILVASTDRLDYVGDTFASNAPNYSGFCKYYIGALNKSTGKMQVRDAIFMRLNPQGAFSECTDNTMDDMSAAEKKDLLTEAFGSKKKQQAMRSRIKSQVKSEEIENVVCKTVNTTDNINQLITQEEFSSNLIPPMNRAASKREDVFNINDVISEAEFAAISEDHVNQLVDGNAQNMKEWIKEESFSHYVLHEIPNLPLPSNERREAATLLVYVEYLMILLGLNKNSLKKKDPIPSYIPSAIRSSLLEKFTQKVEQTRTMSSAMRDKLCINVLITCLFISDFQININEIQPDLKIKNSRLRSFLGALGLRLESSKDSERRIAVLKLPLPDIQKSRFNKRKR